MLEQPRWGFFDVILVYLGILGVTLLGSIIPLRLELGITAFFFLSFSIQFLATVSFVYLFAVVLPRGGWPDLGVRKPSWPDLRSYGLIGGLLLIVMVMLMGVVIKYFQPDLPPQEIEELLRSVTRLPEVLAICFAAVVLAPVAEELFYRGMIYPLFKKYLGPRGGAFLAGLVFGLAHYDLWRALPLAVGGVALCYFYEKSDSILVPMVAHGVWNGFMCLVIYFSVLSNLV